MTEPVEEMDREYAKALERTKPVLGVVLMVARALGQAEAAQKILDNIVRETTEKTRALIFQRKLDADQRRRAEHLLARLRTDIEMMAKEGE